MGSSLSAWIPWVWRLHLLHPLWGHPWHPRFKHIKAYGLSHIHWNECTLWSWVRIPGSFDCKVPFGLEVLPGFGFETSLFLADGASLMGLFSQLKFFPSQISAVSCWYSTNSVCFLSCWHSFTKNNLELQRLLWENLNFSNWLLNTLSPCPTSFFPWIVIHMPG